MQSLAAYAAPFGSRGPTCSCLRPNPSDLQKVGPTRIPIDVDRAHMSGRCVHRGMCMCVCVPLHFFFWRQYISSRSNGTFRLTLFRFSAQLGQRKDQGGKIMIHESCHVQGLSNRFEWGYRSPYGFTVIARYTVILRTEKFIVRDNRTIIVWFCKTWLRDARRVRR